MALSLRGAAFALALLAAGSALAADNVLLIQLRPGGGFTVWHTEGETRLTDDEIMELEAAAKLGGSEVMQTAAGPARVYEGSDGVTIHLPGARHDNVLLVDRDDCNHVRVWHAAGATNLAEDQVADIFMSALPGGGRRITVGEYHVKAFLTRLGVTAALWSPRKGK